MDLNLSGSYAFNKYIFNSRKQEDNESIQDFANALVNLGNTIGADSKVVFQIKTLPNKQTQRPLLLSGGTKTANAGRGRPG